MSIGPQAPEPGQERAADEARRAGRVVRIVLILFCFEIGIVLLLLPWTLLWDNNYFFSFNSAWGRFWLDSYTRGAISGLGLVNLWISLSEGLKFWR